MGQLEFRENALYGQMLKSMLNSKRTEEGSYIEDVSERFLETLKLFGKKKRSRGGRSRRSLLPCAAPVPLSPLQMALQEALKCGEKLGIHAFPVMEQVNPDTGQHERTYDPLPFKTFNELKTACAQYGPAQPRQVTGALSIYPPIPVPSQGQQAAQHPACPRKQNGYKSYSEQPPEVPGWTLDP